MSISVARSRHLCCWRHATSLLVSSRPLTPPSHFGPGLSSTSAPRSVSLPPEVSCCFGFSCFSTPRIYVCFLRSFFTPFGTWRSSCCAVFFVASHHCWLCTHPCIAAFCRTLCRHCLSLSLSLVQKHANVALFSPVPVLSLLSFSPSLFVCSVCSAACGRRSLSRVPLASVEVCVLCVKPIAPGRGTSWEVKCLCRTGQRSLFGV